MMLLFILYTFVTLSQSVLAQTEDNLVVIYENVPEDQPPGTKIGYLIQDARLQLDRLYSREALDVIYFKVLNHSKGHHKYFRIDNRQELKTKQIIDRDEICSHLETCQIQLDLAIEPIAYFNILKVVITITDRNDNSPTFSLNSEIISDYQLEISETSVVNSQFVLPSAEDRDSGEFGVQNYRLLGGGNLFQLSVVHTEGGSDDVKLIVKQMLDREVIDRYQLQLLAYDGGSPVRSGSLNISVLVGDANDNPPIFSSQLYETSVREDTPIGSTFLQVHASDADIGNNAVVTYSLASSTDASVSSLFAINRSTGAVYTLASLDHEAGDVYFLSLVAADSGAPSSLKAYSKVRVSVEDMNDHAPLISIHALTGSNGRVQVLENAPPTSTFVAQVSVSDSDSGDNGRFTCSLQSPHFSLHQAGPGQFKVLTSVSFDREERDMYHMNLVCRDQGAQPQTSTKYVVVEVVDVNDNEPEFSQPSLSLVVAENQEVGSLLGQVNATDLDSGDNARIGYTIIPPGVLHVHPDTGVITTAILLDYEEKAQHEFVVKATDHGSPPKSSSMSISLTVLDLNDNAPKFHQSMYSFGTFENQPENTEIGTLTAYDLDDPPFNVIRYSLDRSTPDSGMFSIDTLSGKLTSQRVLDREFKATYHLTVHARNDDYLTGVTNVTIHVADKNDNAPIVTFPTEDNNTLSIPTFTQVGSPVSQIQASDRDVGNNAALTYSIVSGNEAGFFEIVPLSGKILVSRDLSYASNEMETLVILVQDQGVPIMSSVTQLNIFLNDSHAFSSSSQGGVLTSDTTAVLIICLLVFIITVIVGILFILLVVRPRMRKRRNDGQIYNCRIEASKVGMSAENNNMNDVIETENKMNFVMDAGMNTNSHNASCENGSLVFQNSLASGGGSDLRPSGTNPGSTHRSSNNCALRELQLQVHQLIEPAYPHQPHQHQADPDPDRNSLTDSGRGPSEEGDRLSPHHHQPPLPPRQAKLAYRDSHRQPPAPPHSLPTSSAECNDGPPTLPKRTARIQPPNAHGHTRRDVPCPLHKNPLNSFKRKNSHPYYKNMSYASHPVPGHPHLQYPYPHPLLEQGQMLKSYGFIGGPSDCANSRQEDVESEKSYDGMSDDGSSTTSGSFFIEQQQQLQGGVSSGTDCYV